MNTYFQSLRRSLRLCGQTKIGSYNAFQHHHTSIIFCKPSLDNDRASPGLVDGGVCACGIGRRGLGCSFAKQLYHIQGSYAQRRAERERWPPSHERKSSDFSFNNGSPLRSSMCLTRRVIDAANSALQDYLRREHPALAKCPDIPDLMKEIWKKRVRITAA